MEYNKQEGTLTPIENTSSDKKKYKRNYHKLRYESRSKEGISKTIESTEEIKENSNIHIKSEGCELFKGNVVIWNTNKYSAN